MQTYLRSMNGREDSSLAIREAWRIKGKQRWVGQTHGQGLCLLIIDVFSSMTDGLRIPGRTYEFWRDQNKVRGRFVGEVLGNGFVVARLDDDGLPVSEQNSVARVRSSSGEYVKCRRPVPPGERTFALVS
jgi:hypothetical protein